MTSYSKKTHTLKFGSPLLIYFQLLHISQISPILNTILSTKSPETYIMKSVRKSKDIPSGKF